MLFDNEKEKQMEKEKEMEKEGEREKEKEKLLKNKAKIEGLKIDEKEEEEEEEICESKFLDVKENFDENEYKKEIKRNNTKIINDENSAKFENSILLNQKLFTDGNSPNSIKKLNDFKFRANKIKPKPKLNSQIFLKFNIPSISDEKYPVKKR